MTVHVRTSTYLGLIWSYFLVPVELSLKRIFIQFQFQFELGSNLLSIDRREQTAIACFAYLFYYGRLGDIEERSGE